MFKEKIYEDYGFIHRRTRIALYIIMVCFGLLALGYWKVQILRSEPPPGNSHTRPPRLFF